MFENMSHYFLWPSCVADADIIYSSCAFVFFFLLLFLD